MRRRLNSTDITSACLHFMRLSQDASRNHSVDDNTKVSIKSHTTLYICYCKYSQLNIYTVLITIAVQIIVIYNIR